MITKIKNALKNPKRIPLYLSLMIQRRLFIKKIEKNSKTYYQYRGVLYPDYLLKGNASSFILDKAKKYCKGKGIDIGANKWAYPGAIPIEDTPNQNAYKLDNFEEGSLDYVFSSHCLEHLDRWQEALKLWISKVKIGGIVFLYLPHKSMVLWKPNGLWSMDYHKWSPSYEVVNAFLTANGMKILDYSPGKDKYWSFFVVAKRIR